MSLNKYMHPRNRYRNSKPSFLHLALKYPDFRAMTTQDESGKVFLDFKNSDALRALTRCLLQEDFNLTVELPSDRLVPTLPLRLNYIHWLEDIVGTDAGKWCIDIGTGASCIYPLLGSQMNKWNFLATEKDAENFFHAKKNVFANQLSHLIHVTKTDESEESILSAALESFTASDKFDLCMCNPPFFADHMEAQGLTASRSCDRPDAGSVSTASPQECITTGGEVAFIRQLVEESTVLRDKVRVYSSMVGKKSSLTQLKEELRHQKVAKFSTTEFCQGKTMRWGIAWTYDSTVVFPRSQFEARKTKPPLQYVIPQGAAGVEYKVHELARFIQEVLESIKVHCYQGKKAKNYTSITLTAAENTWCHQRRLRRQKQKQATVSSDQKGEKNVNGEVDNSKRKLDEEELVIRTEDGVKRTKLDEADKSKVKVSDSSSSEAQTGFHGQNGNNKDGSSVENGAVKDLTGVSCNPSGPDSVENFSPKKSGEPLPNDNMVTADSKASGFAADCGLPVVKSGKICDSSGGGSDSKTATSGDKFIPGDADISTVVTADSKEPKEYVLKCVMRLKRAGEGINLELDWLDGKSRELMHQVMTFLQNRLAQASMGSN